MKTQDKIELVKVMVDAAENSKVLVNGLVLIDAEKYLKRLNVELSLLEEEELNQVNEALDEAAILGGE